MQKINKQSIKQASQKLKTKLNKFFTPHETSLKMQTQGKLSRREKFVMVMTTLVTIFVLSCLGLFYAMCLRVTGPVVRSYANAYPNATKVGVSAETLGTTSRYKPVAEVKNYGLDAYPTYGYTLPLDETGKRAILTENRMLNASTTNTGGTYLWMDENGYLYNGTVDNPVTVLDSSGNRRQLFQHSGSTGMLDNSVGMYYGDVSAHEPGVIKRLTFRSRSYSSYYEVTGLYAPAGEVIKIQLTKADMEATGGIIVHIGQALYNGQANNIWEARNFNRMPEILNTMWVTKDTATYDEKTGLYTAYVGSFLGGPIYIRDERVEYSVTISGAVNYAHLILGVTTAEEYAELAKSSAPYFDLEVWDSGVLLSGPMLYAKNYTYDELYQAAILWEKISLVSTKVVNQGVVFIFDPFVAAGAAVAFPGRRSVNCPAGWMASALNYEATVTSGGWGNLHEYHHNFQNFGVGYTGEVTNNSLNLISYSLFTKISSARQLESYGAAGLSGWNPYTSATWTLERVNLGKENGSYVTGTNGLAIYATLMHNLGQDAFIKSTGASGVNYFNKWATNTHQDFSYYVNLIQNNIGTTFYPEQLTQNDYPMFVPVASVYQTGRSYNYDDEKRYITTMQPFVIPYGKSYTVDLNPYTTNQAAQYQSGSIIIGTGFTYKIKSINTQGLNGKFQATKDENIYTFTPNKEIDSGKIIVTLEITTTSGEHTYNGKRLDDVDLVLEFQQSHEFDKNVLERTTYTYDAANMPADAVTAFKNNYQGYQTKTTKDHANPINPSTGAVIQNSNTDVWFFPQQAVYQNNPETAVHVVQNNQVVEIDGKLYFTTAGKYRIYLRGRKYCALFISTDGGKTYHTGDGEYAYITPEINPGNNAGFFANDERTYIDVTITKDESWIYFKEVLICEVINTSMASYIGIGMTPWITPLYTTKYYLKGTNTEVTDLDDYDMDELDVRYFDTNNNQVDEATASNPEQTPPTAATYITAYRQDYEFMKQFTSDYFYTRDYSYTYQDNILVNTNQTVIASEYNRATVASWGNFPLENLTDGDRNTWIHTASAVSVAKPFSVTIDMGAVKTANHLDLYSQNRSDLQIAKSFTLYGSQDGTNFFLVGQFDDVANSGSTVSVDFAETKFRYFKLTVTKSSGYLIISEIEIWRKLEISNGKQYSPDNTMFKYTGDWHTQATNANFGHTYVAGLGAQMRFTFQGTQLALLSSRKYGALFRVYIDGKLVFSQTVRADDSPYAVSYLSPVLSNGTHQVIVQSLGRASIDSVVIF